MTNPYLQITRIKAALRSLDLHPSRSMGQNFLMDAHALQTIVTSAELNNHDTVLEIGPGLGVLTWELLQQAGRVVAVELDKRLAERLSQEFATSPQLTIVQADVLQTSSASLLQPLVAAPTMEDRRAAYQVVANVPYAITSPILRHLLESPFPPQRMVLLVQWEVAARICAQPGDLSILAHSVQLYAAPRLVARVPANSFYPAPAVDSAILRLDLYPQPLSANVPALMRLIKAGFLQARKQLGNALPAGLASMGQRTDKQQVVEALEQVGIQPSRRAETVSLTEWMALAYALEQQHDPA